MAEQESGKTGLVDLLESSFRAHAGRTALSSAGQALSYAELEKRSELIRCSLAERGLGAGHRIGLHAPSSIDAVCAVMGILRAGAAYVPIDVRLPEDRKRHHCRLAAPALLLGEGLEWAEEPGGILPGNAMPEENSPACVFFTSGSTGQPKAVEISHRALAAFATWASRALQLTSDDVLFSTSSLSFDMSTLDLFAGLGAGARVHLVPAGLLTFPAPLAELLERERVSVWYSVPSTIAMLAEHGGLESKKLSLRALVSAGDNFPLAPARKIAERSGCRLFNFFGPTETNVCLAYEVAGDTDPSVPVGFPAAGDQCLIRTEAGEVREQGRGELLVFGPTLMSGYRDGGRLDTSAFVTLKGKLFYPTGDLVERARGDGPFLFRGRADGLVKSWGYRVHPLETELALTELPGVEEAAVVAVPDLRAAHLLHAFVVPRAPAPDEGELLAALQLLLPSQALPVRIHFLESLPLGGNGKVDRSALRQRVNGLA